MGCTRAHSNENVIRNNVFSFYFFFFLLSLCGSMLLPHFYSSFSLRSSFTTFISNDVHMNGLHWCWWRSHKCRLFHFFFLFKCWHYIVHTRDLHHCKQKLLLQINEKYLILILFYEMFFQIIPRNESKKKMREASTLIAFKITFSTNFFSLN